MKQIKVKRLFLSDIDKNGTSYRKATPFYMVLEPCVFYGLQVRKNAIIGKDAWGWYCINKFPSNNFLGNRPTMLVARYNEIWEDWEVQEEYSSFTSYVWQVYKEYGKQATQLSEKEKEKIKEQKEKNEIMSCWNAKPTGKKVKASAQSFRHGFSGWKSDKDYGYNITNRNSYEDYIVAHTPDKYRGK